VTLVPAGASLQAAIDAAVPGDTLQLAAGATFTGNFVLRAKSGAGVITITTAGTLPTGRVSPSLASTFATLTSANTGAVIATETGAHDYALMGLHVKASASKAFVRARAAGRNDATQTTLLASHRAYG
jgi:hypothetical protein